MVKQESQNVIAWQYQQIEEIITNGDFRKLELKKIESLLLISLPKNPDIAGNFIPKLEGLAIKLFRGFQKISVSETSTRDDIICAIVLIYSVLGEEKKSTALLHDVEKKVISGLNYNFVTGKLFNYKEAGGKLAKNNKIWSKLLRAYKRGEISAVSGKSKKVDAMLKESRQNNIFGKLKNIFGM